VTDVHKPNFDPSLWAAYEAGAGQEPPGGNGHSNGKVVSIADAAASRAARIKRLTYRRSELDNIPPPSYLIDGVLNNNVLALLAGKFGTYKSFVSVSWACSVATGKPWFGHEVVKPGPILYIAAEGASGLKQRTEAWESVYNRGQRIPDDRFVVVGGSVRLTLGGDMDAISELCAEVEPRLVIWDTLHRCAPGVEENSNTEMGLIVAAMDRLREVHECTQLVNHHTGHAGERSRGASAIEDDFENSWVIKLRDPEDRSPKNPRTMEHRKCKDDVLQEPIPIRLALCDVSATVERDEERSDDTKWLVEDKVKRKAAECDAAGISTNLGRERLKAAAQQAGIAGVSDTLWAMVVKARKGADRAA
jgi:RecA-family ATPase